MKPAAGQQTAGFEFVQIVKPGVNEPSAAWRRQVRSYAARNPRARRQKVIAYQSDHRKKLEEAANEGPRTSNNGPRTQDLVATGTIRVLKMDPVTPLSAARTDPFASFSRPMSTFESFLLDHCKSGRMSFRVAANREVVHYVVLNALSCLPFITPADEILFRHGMMTHWIQMAATDVGMMSSVFLVACRNLATLQYPELYASQALKYKAETLRMLNLAITSEGSRISDMTITKTLALASDSVGVSISCVKEIVLTDKSQLLATTTPP